MRWIMSATGEPNWRSGRTSASARSGSSPAWQIATPHSFAPDPSGACRKRSLRGELVGTLGGEVAVEREQLGRRLERVHDRPAEDGLDRVRAVLERRHDAEVAAATAHRPEQVGVCVGARGHDLARGEHHLGGEQVVDAIP